tara:strand:- start:556 stop:1779 length:1224 start_codon:yes stop_codon:yes gene_type:complete
MNILFLTPTIPYPPNQGASIRNWGIIYHLSHKHSITLLSFNNHDQTFISKTLQKTCKTVTGINLPSRNTLHRLITILFSDKTDISHRYKSKVFSSQLTTILSQNTFDVIQIEGLEMTPYLKEINNYYDNNEQRPLIVYDAHNAEHIIQSRAIQTGITQPRLFLSVLYSLIQLPRILKLERQTCYHVDTVICVSKEDSQHLQKINPKIKPTIIPNGITLQDYNIDIDKTHTKTPVILFCGKMDYRPNIDGVIWFVTHVLPQIQITNPEVQFHIVGKSPTKQVSNLSKYNGVRVIENVKDIKPYIASSTICVVPLRMGGGTRLKILEAFAMKKAIVSTTIGAEGFPVEHNKHLMIANTIKEQTNTINSLLNDVEKRIELGKAGYQMVKNDYQWKDLTNILETIYNVKNN